MSRWAESAVFYHIYPLGFCEALHVSKEEETNQERLLKVVDWIPHFKALGINAIYFGPLFESYSHGYDTSDYLKIDQRLGSNETFKKVCKALHEVGIYVVVDGVFNHVGREFFAFEDLKKNREASIYKDWFVGINFAQNSPYNDGFSYEGWEGHYNLVKLNLKNPEVKAYLLRVVAIWIDMFKIDGIRLDVAYSLDEDFLRELRHFVEEKNAAFWLMGEIIHGDYSRLLKPDLLHSTTNYECYKGIYSSHNDKNYFEINYSMNRLFGEGGIYKGAHLYNFVDNHDVSRIASNLKQKEHLFNVYTLLFTMPGIPSIYYGSEWQIEGKKENGSDDHLRPSIDLEAMAEESQELITHIKKLADIRKAQEALIDGSYQQVVVKNEQLIFKRETPKACVYVALNLSEKEETLGFKINGNMELIPLLVKAPELISLTGDIKITLPAYSAQIYELAQHKE